MTLSVTPGVWLCAREFSHGNFRLCARFAYILVTGPAAGEVWRLLLLSLLRMERGDRAERVVDRALAAVEADPWGRALVELIAKRRSFQMVLALAQNDVERCQARFYAAATRPERSPEWFRDCLARKLIAWNGIWPTWKSTGRRC